MPHLHDKEVAERLSQYLDKLLDGAADLIGRSPRLADKVAERLAPQMRDEYESWLATIEVMADAELAQDLREADKEADEDAQDYEETRRELGLA